MGGTYYTEVRGLCPVCFILITLSGLIQCCILRQHAKACARVQELKEWKQAEAAANAADVEAQYGAVPDDSIVTEQSTFDYSFEEPANPEDKAGSGFEVRYPGGSVSINGPASVVV